MCANRVDWRYPEKRTWAQRLGFARLEKRAPAPGYSGDAKPQAQAARRTKQTAPVRKPLFSEAYSRGDKILFASGITLSLISAFFPWYVFLNQDQFGVRAVQLGDVPSTGPIPRDAIPAGRIDAPIPVGATAEAEKGLDFFATGTLPAPEEKKEEKDKPEEQPFPAANLDFTLVHIANGRAMIEDDSGLFVVQRGSVLPDSSTVTSIEKRDGKWVVVTSAGQVLQIGS